MSERDELADLVTIGRYDTADAILAAGYRKQRTIETIEELDALPVESIVRSDMGVLWEKDVDLDEVDLPWWCTAGDSRQYAAWRITLPATVLWEPK